MSSDQILQLPHGRTTGELVIELLRASGVRHGRIAGIDESHLAVQQAVRTLHDLHLLNDKKLVCGDPYNLDSIDGLREASQAHGHTTFHVRFAQNALPLDNS